MVEKVERLAARNEQAAEAHVGAADAGAAAHIAGNSDVGVGERHYAR